MSRNRAPKKANRFVDTDEMRSSKSFFDSSVEPEVTDALENITSAIRRDIYSKDN